METEFKVFGKSIPKSKIINFIKISAKIGLILLIFVSIFLLNHSVLLSPDDYNYTWVQGANMERVTNIERCLQTAKYFYNNWTGRVIPHVLIGIFRNLNPYVYEIVNTLVFIFFITTIPKVLGKKSTYLSILAVFGYLAFSMMFGEKFAWISGAFNYLWPSTFLLILIYYFYNYFSDNMKLNKLGQLALILFAFIAGFMHENTAFVGGSFLGCLILFNIKKYFKFEKNKKIVVALIFITFCLGAFANIFAPGNFRRMNETNKEFSLEFLNNYSFNKNVINLTYASIVVVYILKNFKLVKRQKFAYIKFKHLKEQDFELVKTELLYFILPAFIATLPMAVIGYFPPRAFLAYELMFMIVLANNVIEIAKHFEKYNVVIAAISIILTLVVFGRYSPSTLAQINYIIPYKQKVTEQYEKASQNGEKDVLVSQFEYLPWIHREDYINIDNFFPDFNWKMPTNALISMYYGFDRVTAMSEEEYLIELQTTTEGINEYFVLDTETNEVVLQFEYDNEIRFSIPKEKIGIWKLDCRANKLIEKITDYQVRYIGGEITDQVGLDQLLILE